MIVRALLAALLVLAVAAPAAGAADPDGFAGMLPRAAALCAKADSGKLGRKLKPDAGKVKKACRTLRAAYAKALADYRAAAKPVTDQIRAAIQETREACLAARRARNPAACREAQRNGRERTRQLRAQLAPFSQAFDKQVEAARKAFWATIKSLKGAKGLKNDPKPGTAPGVDAPDDSGIDSA